MKGDCGRGGSGGGGSGDVLKGCWFGIGKLWRRFPDEEFDSESPSVDRPNVLLINLGELQPEDSFERGEYTTPSGGLGMSLRPVSLCERWGSEACLNSCGFS